jgi:sRNA-binding carbon storage regulator CsrA
MLVLGRRVGQKLIIDGDIEVKLIDIQPGMVWLEFKSSRRLLCGRRMAVRIDKYVAIIPGVDVWLVSIDCQLARIGVQAPKQISVLRDEIASVARG